jgi:hypothetical protein
VTTIPEAAAHQIAGSDWNRIPVGGGMPASDHHFVSACVNKNIISPHKRSFLAKLAQAASC